MKNKVSHSKVAILGGAVGGLVSALISSPQSQIYWWNKDPITRPNILFWDGIASFSLFYALYYFTEKEIFKKLAVLSMIGFMAFAYYQKEKLTKEVK
ncbi:MAG: hypothetical protein QXO40_00305 [Candidatus Aenigmatarchaeota archaeon]